MQLLDLFRSVGTDKGCYAAAYEMLLREKRKAVRNMLEIGIGTLTPGVNSSMYGYAAEHYRPGGSLRAWRDYFPNADIVGIDNQPDTQFSEQRIRTFLCDSTDQRVVKRLLSDLPRFGVIVDDGSHAGKDQLSTLANFFPAVEPLGHYFIEDIPQNSALYNKPRLVERIIGAGRYFAISDDDQGRDRWKMIVIQADSAGRSASS